MPTSRRLRLRRRLRSGVGRIAAQARRTRIGRTVLPPAVSVVVPFYNVEAYIGACLDSMVAQTMHDFEVILVDDGSPDGSRAVAESYVRRDGRFRLVTRSNGGLGAARNTGVRRARGRYLTFVDSDDLLPPDALGVLLASAERTGSDVVVGAVERFRGSGQWRPGWVTGVHTVRRERIHLHDFLPLLRNLYTWNKLYRRDFWLRQGLWFREGIAYEDQPIVTQMLVAAGTLDVIPDVVYRYRARDDQSSISQQTAGLKDLRDRISAWRATEVALQQAPRKVWLAWLQTLFDAHFHWYLTSAGIEDATYWNELRDVVTELTDRAPAEVWAAARPPERVVLALARQDRRDDLLTFLDLGGRDVRRFPSDPGPGGITVQLPFHGDPDLPDELFLLRPEQLSVAHLVESATWSADGLRVRGWCYLLKVDLARHSSHVGLELRSDTGGSRVFTAQDGVEVVAAMPAQDDWCDYRPGTFGVTIPWDAFGGEEQRWELFLTVRAGGLSAQQPVTRMLRAGSPGALEPAWTTDHARLFIEWRHPEPAAVVQMAPALWVEDLSVSARKASATLSGPLTDRVTDVELVSRGRAHPGRLVRAGASVRLDLPVPPAAGKPPHAWALEAHLRGFPEPVGIELPDLEGALDAVPPSSAVRPARSSSGLTFLENADASASALAVVITDEGCLRVTGRLFGTFADRVRLVTTSVRSKSFGPQVAVVNGRFEATLDLCHDAHRFGRLPLGVGEHLLQVEVTQQGAPSTRLPLRIASRLNRVLPVTFRTSAHEGMLVRGGQGSAQLNLLRPIGQGRVRSVQAARQRALAAPGTATRRGLLVRSYFGEKATDSGVAIQEELRRRGSDLPVYWAVQDHSVPVPGGGTPVVVNSSEWFELLGSVSYYLENMYQPESHHKPAGQVLVQTFHGYPFKQMGHPHWKQQGFAAKKVRSYQRRTAEWDYLVSPAPYSTPLLTRDFGYDGPVLEIGYPRNDILQSPEAPDLRRRVRASFGIEENQTVVLYAPTFRDYLAVNDHRAAMSDFLDFDQISRAFGDTVVVLMRGHAFHARTKDRVGDRGAVLDVTDYPEVNDLYLAADVAVVDYSSLRFDFAVTGKPMIFLVPDIERYVATRGWLFDFAPTAPGPHVHTTAEVIEHLGDLAGLRQKYVAEYAAFRADYLSLEDGHAAARFVDAVMVPRGDA